MSAVFLKLLNLSITASWLILAVILVRFLLKKAPKWISCVLWALVAIRLVCPFSLESALSLVPSAETVNTTHFSARPYIQSGVDVIDSAANDYLGSHYFEGVTVAPRDSLSNPINVISIIWIIGMATMLLYSLISYIRLKKNVSASVSVRDNILACDDVKSPFILGIIKPLIYVPSSMEGETLDYVITHESAHIQRRDHWWKPFGYLLLTVYWFNPLCWLAYVLLCRDIEIACDEKVIRDMDKGSVAAYSQALLDCSFPRRRIAACPLAFGEVGVKERVKSVLNYKKPAFWIIVVAVVACIVVAVCFLTDPKAANNAVDETTPDEVIFEAEVLEIHDGYFLVAPEASWALNSADRIEVPMKNMDPAPEPQVGDIIEITCSGEILETYPARLSKVYGIKVAKKASTVTKWFDCLHGDEMVWDGRREINLDEFPGVTFRWFSEKLEAVTDKETVTLYTGMPIWSVYFCDLNGDFKPEICSSISLGSGMIDNRIIIYDYANKETVDISDRGQFDYTLLLQDGKLCVEKRTYMQDELLASGKLVWNGSYQIIWDFDNETDTSNPNEPPSVSFSSAVTHVGWHEDSGMYQRALNGETLSISSVRHLPIYKIESITELEYFKETFGDSISLEQRYDEVPSFNDVAVNYNDDFFKEYSLLLVYVEAGSGSYRYDAKSISCDEEWCCVNVEQLNHPEAVTADMAGWLIHIEMKKADIQKFTSFDAVLND